MKKAFCLLLVLLCAALTANAAPAEPSSGDQALARAFEEIGKPYEWGAVGPNSYDNSGLVSYCITGMHARIGTCQTFMGYPRVSDPLPGDVCVSDTHCGIYVSPGCMIHVAMMGQSVCLSSIQSDMIIVRPPWYETGGVYPPPETGDRTPVVMLALGAFASAGVILLLLRRKKG